MTDTTKIEKWAFPFKTAGASSTEVSDPQLYYDALAKANSGFYPMGVNGLWHGGVHFDAGTGALLEQSAVRCIADGEVIAYRIDERYPSTQYGQGPTAVHLPFSTGFVLVKHRLELPALPTAAPVATPTPATAASTTATPGTPAPVTPATTAAPSEALTFYSLYMHMLDWANYQAQTTLERPSFWGEGLYQVKTTATDKVLGLNVRAHYKVPEAHEAHEAYKTILANLPRGTTVQTAEASPDGKWLQLTSVTPLATGLAPATGWVYKAEMHPMGESRYLIAEQATDEPTAPLLGLNVRESANQNSNILAVLPHGTQVKISSAGAVGKYRKLIAIVSGSSVPALTPGESGVLAGFVWLDSLDAQSEPKDKDRVYLLPTPAPIKAGELIGHLGQYQDHDEEAPRALLHLEVFSSDDVPAFIAKSRARAASLPDSEKNLLHVQPGTKLVTHTASMCAATPPKISDPGSTIGVTRSIPLAVLNSLPAERKIQTSTPMAGGAPIVTNWWRLDNAFADAGGNLISGWLADVIPTRHSPWEWLGFDFISETTNASEQLANHLASQCLLSEAELPDYQAKISTADNGPIKTRLYDIIDGADGTARDEKLSVEEIRASLSKPWHAQSISQLISHYESEWFWQDAKWDELDKLMEHTPATPNTDWMAEKARIKTLSWWEQVAGRHGVKAGGMAWHFHAMSLVGQFILRRQELISFDQMNQMFPDSSEAKREEVRGLFNQYANRFEINTKERISQFFAQIKTEVGHALVGNEESLWYSVQALKDKFKRYFDTYPAEADSLGYKRVSLQQYNNLSQAAREFYTVKGQYAYSQLPQPDEIAKRVYCCNTSSGGFSLTPGGCGEGLMYKGKGFIQLTWKTNYEQVERILKEKAPEESIDIVANPDQLIETKFGLLSAMGFWDWKKLNNLVQGTTDSTNAITAVVNLNTDSYEKRRDNFTAIYQVFQ